MHSSVVKNSFTAFLIQNKHQKCQKKFVNEVEKYYNEKIVGSKATTYDYSKIEYEAKRYFRANDANLSGNAATEEACKPDLPQE